MKPTDNSGGESHRRPAGLTVIEMTVTLSMMMMLASVVVYSTAGIGDWKKGRNASMELQSIYLAQKSYLSDHPTKSVSSIVDTDLLPYLRDATSIPTVESLEGSSLGIKLDVMPPIVDSGGGSAYDPSDSTEDGLWDVGAY